VLIEKLLHAKVRLVTFKNPSRIKEFSFGAIRSLHPFLPGGCGFPDISGRKLFLFSETCSAIYSDLNNTAKMSRGIFEKIRFVFL